MEHTSCVCSQLHRKQWLDDIRVKYVLFLINFKHCKCHSIHTLTSFNLWRLQKNINCKTPIHHFDKRLGWLNCVPCHHLLSTMIKFPSFISFYIWKIDGKHNTMGINKLTLSIYSGFYITLLPRSRDLSFLFFTLMCPYMFFTGTVKIDLWELRYVSETIKPHHSKLQLLLLWRSNLHG